MARAKTRLRGLAAHGGEERVGTLPFEDALDEVRRHGGDVGAVDGFGTGHDSGGVGVDEDNLVPFFAEGLARLGAGVVELARFPDDDGARAEDQDLLYVGPLAQFGGGWFRDGDVGASDTRGVEARGGRRTWAEGGGRNGVVLGERFRGTEREGE